MNEYLKYIKKNTLFRRAVKFSAKIAASALSFVTANVEVMTMKALRCKTFAYLFNTDQRHVVVRGVCEFLCL